MNIPKILTYSILSLSIVLFLGCHKDNFGVNDSTTTHSKGMPSMFQLISMQHSISKADGFIFMKNHNTTVEREGELLSDGLYTVSASFRDADDELYMPGILSVDGVDIPKSRLGEKYRSGDEEREQLREIFGKTVSVHVAENNTQRSEIFRAEMYNPIAIELNAPMSSRFADNLTTLSAGEMVEWNADPKNDKGIYIILYFDLRHIMNRGMRGQNHSSASKVIQTPDDGSYQLTASDLEGIPEGAVLDFIVGRANFGEVDLDDGKHYVMFGYTFTISAFRFAQY